jgi:uncharacterized protein (DUF433 family)
MEREIRMSDPNHPQETAVNRDAAPEESFEGTVVDSLIALTESRLAATAGVSLQRLRRWSQEFELARPGIVRQISQKNTVRIYRFEDAVEVLVVKALLDHGHSIQRVRKLVDYLRGVEGYARPLREVRFAVPADAKDREIFIRHFDGTWVGDRRPSFSVIEQVLILDEIRSVVRSAASRGSDQLGRAERKRGRKGSREVFAGTRVPVRVVLDYIDDGATDAEILREFPSLNHLDLEYARSRRVAIR